MNTQNPSLGLNAPEKVTVHEAALQIMESINESGYTLDEKIAIRRELDTQIRRQIDDDIQKLQNLRASI